jgi:hypothetical protein
MRVCVGSGKYGFRKTVVCKGFLFAIDAPARCANTPCLVGLHRCGDARIGLSHAHARDEIASLPHAGSKPTDGHEGCLRALSTASPFSVT